MSPRDAEMRIVGEVLQRDASSQRDEGCGRRSVVENEGQSSDDWYVKK